MIETMEEKLKNLKTQQQNLVSQLNYIQGQIDLLNEMLKPKELQEETKTE